jgi:hypothetical protein
MKDILIKCEYHQNPPAVLLIFFDHCSEIFKTKEDRDHINCRSASYYVIIEEEMAANTSKISS